jgi:hypothetical protein
MLTMDFSKVTFDKDVDELEAEEARELISNFQTAQEQNIAEFEAASEQIDELEGTPSEFEEADEQLTAEVAEATFMSEDEAATLSFGRKREILADFSEVEEEDEETPEGDEGSDGGATFSNMGQRGETHDEEEAERNVADQYLGDMTGLQL